MEADQHAARQSPIAEGQSAARPEVRLLRRDDARGVSMLVASCFAELGTGPAMSVEQTEQLFATPWLEGGAGLVLEHGSEMAGYGFARPTRWKGTDSIQVGLTLRRGYRDRETYHILTDRLLETASALARKHEVSILSTHFRSTDTVHPSVMLELGFKEHPVSMLGFRHDLADIPSRHLPDRFSCRPARLPDEKAAVLNLSGSAFDDRDRQGEPIGDTYVDFIAGKSGFDPEQVLLVEDSNGPVGCAVVNAPAQGVSGDYSILELCVLPGSRRIGIGSALVCRVLVWLKTHGSGAALTSMFSTNLAATLFWRLGFRPDPGRTFRFFVRDAVAPPTQCQTGVTETSH
jgi:ribosomal protein S18 acetylase RimI-like enzyme